MRKIVSLLIVLMMCIFCTFNSVLGLTLTQDGITTEYTGPNVTLILNGEKFTPSSNEMPPIIVESRTLVPIREVFEKLGGKVDWDSSTKSAFVTLEGQTIKLTINSLVAYVNENAVSLDVPAKIINNKTMVPVRFISENAGLNVGWEPNTKTVTINKEKDIEYYYDALKDKALRDIPEYSYSPYIVLNNNKPFFKVSDFVFSSYEKYSELDYLNRCGVAMSCIGRDIMPTEERGNIGSVRPTGWHTVKYAGIDGNYLYNRCHLIGYQLTAENANVKNLITGTRYMNVEGMLPFENMVADYIKETGNHVLYRVTPIFKGENLLASGVLMEAESIEDNGKGIKFCVYCYNVQPGIWIDYQTGESSGPEFLGSTNQNSNYTYEKDDSESIVENIIGSTEDGDYILNTNTRKFHYSYCRSVKQMSEKNKRAYTGDRKNIIIQGYVPCKICNP